MWDDATLIGRLRVTGAGLDPLLTRLRAEHLLAAVELRPSRLPPAAILCVRALRDPRPHTLRFDAPQPSPPREWQGALAAQLDDLAARAVRPLAAPVPAGADAVIFADRAELLACLALDWRETQILNRWWWREFLRNIDVRKAVLLAWLTSPEFVPAALTHLVARAEARAFLAALTDQEIDHLTQEVMGRFGLRAVQQALTANPEAIAGPARGLAAETEERDSANVTPLPAPPWEPLLDGGPTLSPARELLLGIGLSLARRPGEARTAEFARRVDAWYRAAIVAPHTPEILPPVATERGLPDVRRANVLPANPAAPGPESDSSATRSSACAPEPSHVAGESAPARPKTPGPTGTPASVPKPIAPASFDRGGALVPSVASSSESSAAPEPIVAEGREPLPAAPEMPLEIETQFGGLFYLVNVALALGLYADFTQLETLTDVPSLWDFLALLGEALLGSELRADPVWELLAQLAGRGDAEPGAGFLAPTEWFAPNEWPDIFGRAGCHWAATADRLRAWHPAGFWLWDVPFAAASAALLSTLAAPSGETGPGRGQARTDAALRGDVPRPRPDALACWVDWWAAYLRARLIAALGLDGAEGLAALLFRYRARVLVSAARLDVVLHLDDLALAVRYAGLDRDPGWVPAAGRTLAFHFETRTR